MQNGDHLTREEFERRYEAMPDLKKAELIEGVVYIPSPVRTDQHGTPHAAMIGWLALYWANTPGVRVAADSTIRLDLDNEPQPDALLCIEPVCRGQVRITGGYIEGAPELVAEVAASTVSIDLNAKLQAYLRNGVREYIVWRVLDQAIDWFVLQHGQFQPMQADAGGMLHSQRFPGMLLDPAAMVHLEVARVFQILQQGLATPEHAAFVSKLQQARSAHP